MLTVSLWKAGEEEPLGSWYPEEDQVQVPRRGDILWLETDEIRHSRWKVVNVQWSFRNSAIGLGRTRMIVAEVHVRPYPTHLLERVALWLPLFAA